MNRAAVTRSRTAIQRAASEQALRAHKRIQQARDIAHVNAGRASAASMCWFSREQARDASIDGAPY